MVVTRAEPSSRKRFNAVTWAPTASTCSGSVRRTCPRNTGSARPLCLAKATTRQVCGTLRCECLLPHDVCLTTLSWVGVPLIGSDDPRVLKGSCGVEYELWYTEQGRRSSQSSYPGRRYSSHSNDYAYNDYGSRYSSGRYGGNQGWGLGTYIMLVRRAGTCACPACGDANATTSTRRSWACLRST